MTFPEDALMNVDALVKHWEFYHPVEKRWLDLTPDLVKTRETETYTSLPVYKNSKNNDTIWVQNINGDVRPPVITVDDDGIFEAIYDPKELAEIISLKAGWFKASKNLHFRDLKWDIPIYEHITSVPEALLYTDTAYAFLTDLKAVPTKAWSVISNQAKAFPCPVYSMTGKRSTSRVTHYPPYERSSQQNWLDRGGYDYYDERYWPGRTQPTQHFQTQTWKASCGFDSTKGYLSSVLGVQLNEADRKWYIDDNRVEASGLPHFLTITVLNELVAPYGVEVNRVWVSEYFWTDELTKMAETAMIDNEGYAMMKKIKPDLPEPRIFVVPAPPEGIPMVSMTAGNGANPGGHASYLGARDTRPATGWKMSLDFRRIK